MCLTNVISLTMWFKLNVVAIDFVDHNKSSQNTPKNVYYTDKIYATLVTGPFLLDCKK